MGQMIEIGDDSKIEAYLALPEGNSKGGIIVIHEVWGLVDQTKDVADRLAKEGYVALAPELLGDLDFAAHDVGQLQKDLFNPETRNKVQPELRKLMTPMQNPGFGEKTLSSLKDCFNYLYDDEQNNQNVAVIGFCFGGTYSFSLAVNETRLKLALPFYGHTDHSIEQLAKIACPVRAFYGRNDERLMESLPDLRLSMSQAGVDFEDTVYDNCGHAFFNDTNPFAYNEVAAKSAWKRVLSELERVM